MILIVHQAEERAVGSCAMQRYQEQTAARCQLSRRLCLPAGMAPHLHLLPQSQLLHPNPKQPLEVGLYVFFFRLV